MNYHIIISDGVFLSKEPKPIKADFLENISVWNGEKAVPTIQTNDVKFEQALKEWHSKLIPVVNLLRTDDGKYWFVSYDKDGVPEDLPELLLVGQQVTAEIKDGKATITEINN